MVLVKYNKETLEVEGFFTEEQREENENYIEIEADKEIELLKLNQNGTLFVKNVETKEFEARQVKLKSIIKPQDNLNAQLLKQNAELRAALGKQQAFNSQILLEMAKLKGGNV
ncbi:hypothetical protein [Clostridium cadaveris]|uniref:hypothetical protein n=1 Tax=Clostridium cadaveris TaxID=1529 RepID=UPI0004026E3E|nr:hypothetical protein [Clostridium cadaveris]